MLSVCRSGTIDSERVEDDGSAVKTTGFHRRKPRKFEELSACLRARGDEGSVPLVMPPSKGPNAVATVHMHALRQQSVDRWDVVVGGCRTNRKPLGVIPVHGSSFWSAYLVQKNKMSFMKNIRANIHGFV